MFRRYASIRSLAGVGAGLGLLIPVTAGSAPDDDLFLFTSNYPPNVVLLQDNSKSMTHIEWHPAFDPTAVPDCSYWDNDRDYVVGVDVPKPTFELKPADTPDADCWNKRKIFDPASAPEVTRYTGRYLNWYFSDAADPYITEIETAKHNPPGCSAPACTNCDEKYRRTRSQMGKQVLLDVLCLAEPRGVRFGQAFFRDPADVAGEDPNGGYLAVEVDDPTPPHASDLEAHIKNLKALTETPLGESLFQIYTFFMSRDPANIPLGRDGITKFPAYIYSESTGVAPAPAANIPKDPMEASCQKSFVVIVTDGAPDRDDWDEDPLSTSVGFADFPNLIGDYYQPVGDEVEIPGDPQESAWYLDDIAKYMHDKDFRPDWAGDQTLDIYTIGLATDSATDQYLQRVADVSDGLFFHAKDGDELSEALVNALNDIIEKSQSFTAATVPSSRTADGGDFYTSYFFPSGKSAFWLGHLRSWHITASGDIEDASGSCALEDPDAGECNSGPFKPDAQPFWDAGEEVPLPASRALWVSKIVSGSPQKVAFDGALGAADLGISAFSSPGSPPDPTPNSILYTLAGSTAIHEEGLADEVVAYARGCVFGTGTDGLVTVETPQACVPKFWRLGDIFHSNPAVVRAPGAFITDASYSGPGGFKENFATRDRVIYAGSNDGFLHAFHAGDWDAGATPPAYTEGTGVELFGFMPWQARLGIKNQPIDAPTARTYFVDGSPQVSDWWQHSGPGDVTKTPNEWRSTLVGGMRQGGFQYFALDVTDPSGVTYTYPGYMWEFPSEDAGSLAAYGPFMGETWAQPIITRVKVDYAGTVVERWVAIVTGGYHELSDPNDALYDDKATEGRAIYILDLKTGEVLGEKKYDDSTSFCKSGGAATPEQQMCFAIPSTPAVFDVDFDGYADIILVGDLGGNVWKWVIHPVGDDPVNDAGDSVTQPSWPFGLFFQAPTATISGTTYYKSFFTTPAAAIEGGRLFYAFATGERAGIPFAGLPGSDKENNRLYVVVDPDRYGVPAAPQTETDPDGAGPRVGLEDRTASVGCAPLTGPGYFLRVADGEKFVTRVNIFASLVIAATFRPVPALDPCTAKGEAKLYAFDLLCGEGYFDDGAGGKTRELDLGVGLPTDPQISLGVGGSDNRIYIEKSDGGLESPDAPETAEGGRLLYWRELP